MSIGASEETCRCHLSSSWQRVKSVARWEAPTRRQHTPDEPVRRALVGSDRHAHFVVGVRGNLKLMQAMRIHRTDVRLCLFWISSQVFLTLRLRTALIVTECAQAQRDDDTKTYRATTSGYETRPDAFPCARQRAERGLVDDRPRVSIALRQAAGQCPHENGG